MIGRSSTFVRFVPITGVMRHGVTARIVAGLGGQSLIHLEYDGTTPPLELFARLRELGWQGAAPGSPPAEAVDWSRPDVASGRRYTLLPHRAFTSATFDGTPEVRVAAVARARAALAEWGADAGTPSAPTSGEVIAAEIVCDERDAPTIAAAVRGFGEVREDHPDTWETEICFRGNRSTTVQPARRFVVAVAPSTYDDLLSALAGRRVHAVRRR